MARRAKEKNNAQKKPTINRPRKFPTLPSQGKGNTPTIRTPETSETTGTNKDSNAVEAKPKPTLPTLPSGIKKKAPDVVNTGDTNRNDTDSSVRAIPESRPRIPSRPTATTSAVNKLAEAFKKAKELDNETRTESTTKDEEDIRTEHGSINSDNVPSKIPSITRRDIRTNIPRVLPSNLKRNTTGTGVLGTNNNDSTGNNNLPSIPPTNTTEEVSKVLEGEVILKNKDEITLTDLNDNQSTAVDWAVDKKTFVLTGSAGTGKTTTVRVMTMSLTESGKIRKLVQEECNGHKTFAGGMPAVAIISYTNQAVRNIKEALPPEYQRCCMTIHKLVQYAPVWQEVWDEAKGDYVNKMRFLPTYGTHDFDKDEVMNSGEVKKLPHFDLIIIEESGTVSEFLYNVLLSALPDPENTSFIMLGDLEQNPPVFDDAILGFALLDRPRVTLDQVYRNVGLITKLAQRLLTGKPMLNDEVESWNQSDDSGTIKLLPFKGKNKWEVDLKAVGTSLYKLAKQGRFKPGLDCVLVPFNVKFGTIELNKYILQGLTEANNSVVHEVIAGVEKQYLAIGDVVLYERYYRVITAIEPNPDYIDAEPMPPSEYLDRWGNYHPDHRDAILGKDYDPDAEQEYDLETVARLLEADATKLSGADGIARRAASHIIKLSHYDPTGDIEPWEYEDDEAGMEITRAGEINAMLPINSMTIHKAQGSEFRHVYLIMHWEHGRMVNREMLYTGITRSRRDLTMFYHPKGNGHAGTFVAGIRNQQIQGTGIEAKMQYFRKKRANKEMRDAIAKKKEKES